MLGPFSSLVTRPDLFIKRSTYIIICIYIEKGGEIPAKSKHRDPNAPDAGPVIVSIGGVTLQYSLSTQENTGNHFKFAVTMNSVQTLRAANRAGSLHAEYCENLSLFFAGVSLQEAHRSSSPSSCPSFSLLKREARVLLSAIQPWARGRMETAREYVINMVMYFIACVRS